MACPILDLKIFRRACTLCCGSPSKNSTLFSHNQLRTIAQRRKTRKKTSQTPLSHKIWFWLSDFWVSSISAGGPIMQTNFLWSQICIIKRTNLRWLFENKTKVYNAGQYLAEESAYLMTTWWLPDDCPDDCLMTVWWLPEVSLMTAWWLPEDCLTTAWRLPDDWKMTAWRLPDDCLTTAWKLPSWKLSDH